jgi:PIN domain nuclease of toxin-antitoxin system
VSDLVIDSSALLASIYREQGGEKIGSMLAGARMSSVNVAEVFSKLADAGRLSDEFVETFSSLGLQIIDFDVSQARKVGELRPITKHLGLSLGDRCCLALAILSDATAVTADRSWKKFKLCPVDVIR